MNHVRFLIPRSLGSRHAWWLAAVWLICQTARSCPAQQWRLSEFVEQRCSDCHSGPDSDGGLRLDQLDWDDLSDHRDTLERALRKLQTRQMPPLDSDRPQISEYLRATSDLADQLDTLAGQQPFVGHTPTLRRLTRTEYRNCIRDLLSLDVDVQDLLPADSSSHGFDNVTVDDLSPTLMNRYVLAAQKISRMAVGRVSGQIGGTTIRIRPDITQEDRMPGLPLGTRGGTLIDHVFPQTGEYEIELRLARDRNEHVEGLKREHTLEILVDRNPVESFTVRPARDGDHSQIDRHLRTRLSLTAGPHQLGITFIRDSRSLMETMRQPLESKFNTHRHPRQAPALYEISIVGPYASQGPGDTPSRRRLFVCYPDAADQEVECAQRILSAFVRRAYRRPVDDNDLQRPMQFFQDALASTGDFEAGIEAALSCILVSPHFLFRIEPAAEDQSDSPRRLSDLELASRLSFFVWSSLPDERLLELAEQGRLRDPDVLESQVRRLLADRRAKNLVDNFAAQWLYLRNLDSITPDARLFPDFDDNLRQAFRRETELLFEEVWRDDLSVLQLIRADHTYLNQRLAKHYGIPHVFGSHFRPVALDPTSHRGGILRHGSILTVTSYATRTSPVIRGHWVLKNLLGSPPPPPPPNVPTLDENSVDATLPLRSRLAAHSDHAACAGCHRIMDPVGFALENYDAIGRWRDVEQGRALDVSGGLPDGSEFAGVAGLEEALIQEPEWFVTTLTEKLMTFALGRGVEPLDGAAVREIVRRAQPSGYRLSSLITGIALSPPFQWKEMH